jgi:hypothetical protein
MDPFCCSRAKAKEWIGERLEQQYAKWQLLARTARPLKYRQALDPTVEDVRTLCFNLRRQARTERLLLHYNGDTVCRDRRKMVKSGSLIRIIPNTFHCRLLTCDSGWEHHPSWCWIIRRRAFCYPFLPHRFMTTHQAARWGRLATTSPTAMILQI